MPWVLSVHELPATRLNPWLQALPCYPVGGTRTGTNQDQTRPVACSTTGSCCLGQSSLAASPPPTQRPQCPSPGCGPSSGSCPSLLPKVPNPIWGTPSHLPCHYRATYLRTPTRHYRPGTCLEPLCPQPPHGHQNPKPSPLPLYPAPALIGPLLHSLPSTLSPGSPLSPRGPLSPSIPRGPRSP